MADIRIPFGPEDIPLVAAQPAPGMRRATAEDFGGNIGAELAQFGNVLASLGAKLAQQRKQASDAVGLAKREVERNLKYYTDVEEGIRNAPPGAPGLTQSLWAKWEKESEKADKNLESDYGLSKEAAVQARVADIKLRGHYASKALAAEHNAQLAKLQTDFGEATASYLEGAAVHGGFADAEAKTRKLITDNGGLLSAEQEQAALDSFKKSLFGKDGGIHRYADSLYGPTVASKDELTAKWSAVRDEIDSLTVLSDGDKRALKQEVAGEWYEKFSADNPLEARQFRLEMEKSKPSVGQQFWQERWSSKAKRAPHFDIDPEFDARLRAAVTDAETATGAKASIRSLKRTGVEQAAAYKDYLLTGGLAAPPAGMKLPGGKIAPGSRHERGQAADIESGPVLDWLHKNAGKYGLEFLKGSAFTKDPVHIQIAREDTRKMAGGPQVTIQPTTPEGFMPLIFGKESSGDQSAVSPKGARGIGQIMPGTAPEAAKLAGLPWDEKLFYGTDEKAKAYNQALSTAYFKAKWNEFDGDPAKALAAYNYGAEHVKAAIRVSGDEWLSRMPAETTDYVNTILGQATEVDQTTVSGPSAADTGSMQDYISWDAWQKGENKIDAAIRDERVAAKAQIDATEDDILNSYILTGTYNGKEPEPELYSSAYGENGGTAWEDWTQRKDSAIAMHEMASMTNEEIAARIAQSSAEVQSGPGITADQKRFQAEIKVAEEVIKARADDPAGYVYNQFPQVKEAWKEYDPKKPETGKNAVALTLSMQTNLGIQRSVPMPKLQTKMVADMFNNVEEPPDARTNALVATIGMTSDPAQQKALFRQLIDAGVPAMTEPAIAASMRGDLGAARRLFAAAMVNAEKGIPHGPAGAAKTSMNINLESAMFGPGTIGEMYYSLDRINPDNAALAQRDLALMQNAVALNMAGGMYEKAAISQATADLFGKIERFDGSLPSGNAVIGFVDEGTDKVHLLASLQAVMPKVREAVIAASHASYAQATEALPEMKGQTDILTAAHNEEALSVLENGSFRRIGFDGWGFFNPTNGGFVPDSDGKILIFTDDELLGMIYNPKPPMPRSGRAAGSGGQ